MLSRLKRFFVSAILEGSSGNDADDGDYEHDGDCAGIELIVKYFNYVTDRMQKSNQAVGYDVSKGGVGIDRKNKRRKTDSATDDKGKVATEDHTTENEIAPEAARAVATLPVVPARVAPSMSLSGGGVPSNTATIPASLQLPLQCHYECKFDTVISESGHAWSVL